MKIYKCLFALILFSHFAFAQLPKNENQFRDYFNKRADSLDQIEGIWNVSNTLEIYRADTLSETRKSEKPTRIAILKNNGKLESFELTGASFNVQYFSTDVAGVYFYRVYFPETEQYSRKQALISKSGDMEYSLNLSEEYVRQKFKESFGEGSRLVNNFKWSKFYPVVWKK